MRGLTRAVLVAALAATACTAPAGPEAAGGEPAATAGPSATALGISVASSAYGALELRTTPGAACTVRVRVPRGEFGDGPPDSVSGVAAADGTASFTYPAPPAPAGRGRQTAVCESGGRSAEASADFAVAERTLDARGFTARIQPVDPIGGLGGVSARLDPSLAPARDADVAALRATLAEEWSLATRGLGAVTLVDANADIVLYVLPGEGTSLNVRSSDGTRRVLLYVSDEFGTTAPENLVAVALHELGHLWCCRGPDAGPDGHWKEKIPDPLLQGVDRYGLMTHPVTCLVKARLYSCPNRFSERELRTFGFTDIPAPPPNACADESAALAARLATLDASLARSKAAVDAMDAQLADLRGRIKSIEAQYPSLVLPPAVYATYNDLVARYNALAEQERAAVATHNAGVATRNDVAARLDALPCQ